MIIFLFTTTIFAAPSASSVSADPVSFYYLPGIPDERYERRGHINIGALVETKAASESADPIQCSDKQSTAPSVAENTEAISLAIDMINRRQDILANVTVGFIMESYCIEDGIALGKSMTFLPRSESASLNNECPGQARNFSWLGHDVIGLLATGYSHLTIPISSLFSVGRVPLMGVSETSDELSNKLVHSYFFRIVPPDRYQVKAILKFISTNGWSYISVLYVANNYGQNAYDTLKLGTEEYGICIATSHKVSSITDYNLVIEDLLLNSRARAVVVFTWNSLFKRILQAAVYQNATRQFIWIGSDAISFYNGHEYIGTNIDPGIGAFTFKYYTTYISEFFTHMREQTPWKSKNPWLKKVWESLLNCSVDNGTCHNDTNILQSTLYQPSTETSIRLDAILTLAHAADMVLKNECPQATGISAKACITGEKMRKYLKKVSLEAYTGHIKFDSNQDRLGRYSIHQLVFGDFRYPPEMNRSDPGVKRVFWKEIGIFDTSRKTISYERRSVSWSHLDVLERIIPRPLETQDSLAPESVCSGPCLPGEIKIEKEVPCCWDCYRCRDNERLVRGNTSCEACPSLTWPDPSTAFTTCIDIPPSYPLFTEPIPILFVGLAMLVLLFNIVIAIAYGVYHNEKVIKASSRELSILQLIAIFLGYATIILFQLKPSGAICAVIFFSFCMSFVMLYSPLLVKTIRIFRIFKSGAKNKRPRFISPNSQMAVALSLITVQIVLCSGVYVMYQPTAVRTQPIWSDKFVELSCSLTLPGLSSFLGYNIVLVSLCSVFAFTVRKLPNNFNESKFISMCVATTLLIWLAFTPTYFTADREYIRTFLLSVALLLNHTVALVFLFVPKIYAAKFLPPEEGEFSNSRSKATS